MIKTLAVETSCDDTSVGIVSFDGKFFSVEKLLAYSQIQNHQQYGGVVPEIASRLHSEKIIEVLEHLGWDSIKNVDFVSVTTHPGLPGALVVGKATAHLLSDFFDKALVEVHHIYGHVFSLLLERKIDDIDFPLVVLTASGGHNDLYLVENVNLKLENSMNQHVYKLGKYSITKIGQTLDDAAGECFDKVARMLGGPYPGGQRISEKAGKFINSKNGISLEHSEEIYFKRIFLSKQGFDFSFSGMKSQVSYFLKKLEKKGIVLTENLVCKIAYEFQEAVIEVLVKKLIRAGLKYNAKTLGIAGGVSCNERLREYLNQQLLLKKEKIFHDMIVVRPMKKVYSTDNAAMIGLVGVLEKLKNK